MCARFLCVCVRVDIFACQSAALKRTLEAQLAIVDRVSGIAEATRTALKTKAERCVGDVIVCVHLCWVCVGMCACALCACLCSCLGPGSCPLCRATTDRLDKDMHTLLEALQGRADVASVASLRQATEQLAGVITSMQKVVSTLQGEHASTSRALAAELQTKAEAAEVCVLPVGVWPAVCEHLRQEIGIMCVSLHFRMCVCVCV